jgi:hypothetical protein
MITLLRRKMESDPQEKCVGGIAGRLRQKPLLRITWMNGNADTVVSNGSQVKAGKTSRMESCIKWGESNQIQGCIFLDSPRYRIM